MNNNTIAKTILSQIGTNSLMCIAAHRFVALPENDKNLGGVSFKVGRNPKMKQGGTVAVTLDFNDTYSVKIVSARGKTLLDVSGVYCDNLGRDGVIEGVTG